jgi:hypothetical protein
MPAKAAPDSVVYVLLNADPAEPRMPVEAATGVVTCPKIPCPDVLVPCTPYPVSELPKMPVEPFVPTPYTAAKPGPWISLAWIQLLNSLPVPNWAYTLFRVVSSVEVFKPSATEPEVPEPVSGLEVVIPVMVPVPPPPGKVCAGTKLIVPLLPIENPVAAGLPEPAYSRSSFAASEAVLLLVARFSKKKF